MFETATSHRNLQGIHAWGRTVWRLSRPLRDWAILANCCLGFIIKRTGLPRLFLFFGVAPGDDLLCSAVLHELRRRGRDKIVMISNHPDLFKGREDAMQVVRTGRPYKHLARILQADLRNLEYARVHWEEDRSTPPSQHIIAELCACAGITGSIDIRPYLSLTENEKADEIWAKEWVAIQSGGMDSVFPMKNKQWYPERFQSLINALRNEFRFVQIGSKADPPLEYVKDLRGMTSIRKTASILHHSRLYVGNVGFLMHLARAMECPSVIIYGGREAPWQSGYTCNKNLYTPLHCSPCWRWNTCDFDRKCMSAITVGDAMSAVREMVAMPRNPLKVDTAIIAHPRRTNLC